MMWIIGIFIFAVAAVEILYLFLLHGCYREVDRQTDERIEALYRDDLDFDFDVKVDKVKFGDEE